MNTKQVLIKSLPHLNEFQFTIRSVWTGINVHIEYHFCMRRGPNSKNFIMIIITASMFQNCPSLPKTLHGCLLLAHEIIIEITVCWLPIRFQNLQKNHPKRSNCFYVVKSVLCFGILYFKFGMFGCLSISLSVDKDNQIWFHFTVEPLIVY